MMGTHKPGEGPDPALEEARIQTPEGHSAGEVDPQSERLMEQLLADCLSLPRHRIDAAVDETCRKHPHLATKLRQRYLDLLQIGILEHHEGGQQESEAAQ